jgi:hypothetical protein
MSGTAAKPLNNMMLATMQGLLMLKAARLQCHAHTAGKLQAITSKSL